MDEFDTDVENYTTEELLNIVGINDDDEDPTVELVKREKEKEIVQFTDAKISQYEKVNPELAAFFRNIKTKLLANIQVKSDPIPTVKIFNSDVKKGTLNPTVTNTVTRTVNIDSYYRAALEENNANTDNFVFTMNETLSNTLSLALQSVEIPNSWYTFTAAKGNTGFVLSTLDPSYEVVSLDATIPEGNYTNFSLMQAVQTVVNGFLSSVMGAAGDWWVLAQDPVHGRVRFAPQQVNNSYFPFDVKFRWFDVSYDTAVLANATINNNLGWLLGFRFKNTFLYSGRAVTPSAPPAPLTVAPATVTAPAIIYTRGTKYIVMKLNDHKTNRLNNGLVSINNNINTQISLPSYMDADVPRSRFTVNKSQFIVSASHPRRLTASQLHTINAISRTNSGNNTTVRTPAFDDADIFAKIPLNSLDRWSAMTNGVNAIVDDGPAKLHVDFSGPLQKNVRTYFGPVNLTTMQVSLYDDKGFLLGLNGMDWSFALTATGLYSY